MNRLAELRATTLVERARPEVICLRGRGEAKSANENRRMPRSIFDGSRALRNTHSFWRADAFMIDFVSLRAPQEMPATKESNAALRPAANAEISNPATEGREARVQQRKAQTHEGS
jgi:hypothetical protein